MGFKVASRVRGLSDEAVREAFGAEELDPYVLLTPTSFQASFR